MSVEKQILHPRNLHRSRYDFPQLINSCPQLETFVFLNPYGDLSIDFSDPLAVKTLNKALLIHFYGLKDWDIPEGYLCPPIPGRADYIHYLADLLASVNEEVIPEGHSVKVLDIGVGANCVYPIIGHQIYGWAFVGSDVDKRAISSATNIAAVNPSLSNDLTFRLQNAASNIFRGVVKPGELFDLTLCNPPFHTSAEEAQQGSQRKVRNLGKQKGREVVLNFGGQNAELWCKGGEVEFIRKMIEESTQLATQCCWFTSLVSKSAHLSMIYYALERAGAKGVKTVEMAQGQKQSRFVAWTFLSPAERTEWSRKRWKK
ncbi:23S rRNA (adenine(1618)-N(6))-methyltransferase RlmF [Pedobacter cryoconitis]|uniref:Ribosomal RNA large subunit methyltransferase F n=1 Tax=Pedobacter cryoconitis TaxID=188932 RepID=A0A7X0MK28_9SPHI|nr:23S rRNA (adenine(1618)-N(6))-methyltransferase RlmF [Pedobacter cryoconitis]MBB6500240.1 23S rRNA (adenine1618-N6)-methyltransferase [Pedobacter cryoconitis]